ncbi:MAG: hypothetical protein ACREGL_02530 [Alphaproteobacteria bacterium]
MAKKSLFIIAGAVLLIGLGGGGYVLLAPSEPAGEHAAVPEAGVQGTFFVPIHNLMVPVVRGDRIERHVALTVALEVEGEESRMKVMRALPRLRDALLADLYSYLRLIDFDREPSFLPAVKTRLTAVANRTMGADTVRAVLVQYTYERPVD